jgi:hypothetical protein
LAKPTGGVVASANSGSTSNTTLPYNTWTTLATVTVGSSDIETLFAFGSLFIMDLTATVSGYLNGRIIDASDNVKTSVVSCAFHGDTNADVPATFFFTIPENMTGQTLRFQVLKPWSGNETVRVAYLSVWGHSAHSHR